MAVRPQSNRPPQPPVVQELEPLVSTSASGACPDPARPVEGWGRDGNTSLGVEHGADALEGGVARVRVDGWPDSEGAFVDQG